MNTKLKKTVLIAVILFMANLTALPHPVLSEETGGFVILHTEEIKVEGEEEERAIVSLEEVEAARVLTKERVYGLLFLWFLIALCIVLLKYQLKDDEKLYASGYYSDSPGK